MENVMNIFISGLGLIGGSLAKALRFRTIHNVCGFDTNEGTCKAALASGAINKIGTADDIKQADVIIVALYPAATIEFVKENVGNFKENAIIVDTCGIKTEVCKSLGEILSGRAVRFVGGHPMAGTQFWGFDHSRSSLFKGASMILTPHGVSDIAVLEKIKNFFCSVGFADTTFTSPEEHDRIIAYTSQLAHIVSNAYIKSPTVVDRKGFSAGSYKDMTRVAKLNEEMWTELFIGNKDNLVNEIDTLIDNLQKYRSAVDSADSESLLALLRDGRETKKQVG